MATRAGFGLDAMVQLAGERVRRRITALKAWLGDTEPVPAEVPPWPEGSLGYRLLAGTPLGEARDAPSLLTAHLPDPQTIADDPRHWTVATEALIRALVFDGLTLDHPAVSALLGTLTSVVEAEIAHMQAMDDDLLFDSDDEGGFPALDGPVFLLGRALVEAVWAVVGDDSLADVPSVLVRALAGVVPGLDALPLVDALIAGSYTCEDPTDTRPLQRLMNLSDNPLEILALAGKVPPGDVLSAGLLVLSALAQLCHSDSVSVLERTTSPGT